MDLFCPWGFYAHFCGHSTMAVHRFSKPVVAGSSPAARSSPKGKDTTDAVDVPLRIGCRQGSAVPAPKRQRPGDPVMV